MKQSIGEIDECMQDLKDKGIKVVVFEHSEDTKIILTGSNQEDFEHLKKSNPALMNNNTPKEG